MEFTAFYGEGIMRQYSSHKLLLCLAVVDGGTHYDDIWDQGYAVAQSNLAPRPIVHPFKRSHGFKIPATLRIRSSIEDTWTMTSPALCSTANGRVRNLSANEKRRKVRNAVTASTPAKKWTVGQDRLPSCRKRLSGLRT